MGLKNITVTELTKESLPKMNAQQIAFFLMILVYIVALLLPNFMSNEIPLIAFLNNLNVLGVSTFCIVVMMIIPYQGKPMLDFRAVSKKFFSWDVFFLVVAALYICTAMTTESTGIKPFLVQLLQPMLGNKPEIIFIFFIIGICYYNH